MADPKRTTTLAGYVEERTLATSLPGDAWAVAYWDARDQAAFKALRDGTATPDQQMRALGWVFFASSYHDDASRPGGEEGARASERLAGKRSIAVQIRRMLELALMRDGSGGEQGER